MSIFYFLYTPVECIIHIVLFRFSNPNPLGSAREGHIITGGGVQPPVYNGFSKGTQVHRFSPSLDSGRVLREMHPYVARYDRGEYLI